MPLRFRRVFHCLAIIAIVLTATVHSNTLTAQTSSTEILGRVADASGAVIPGALTIRRTATGETRSTTTNQSGDYTFPLIEVGLYSVICEAPGFRSSTVTGLRVETQQKARVDFAMQVGDVAERVEVAASAVALQTDDASIGSSHREQARRRPAAERPQFTRRHDSPACSTDRERAWRTAGRIPDPRHRISVIANGQREINQSVTIDGAEPIMPLYNHTLSLRRWMPSRSSRS